MERYIDMLCAEISATAPQQPAAPLETVYFGGGTPSLVPPALLGRVLAALRARYGISPSAEVSMEADPGTFDADRLREYMGLGVTRFSVGVQSFQQELLDACGRSHTLDDVHAALATVAASGVPSWSLDLIGGLPKLDAAKWEASLREALRLRPPHVSVYDLQVEEGTPFARWYQQGMSPLPQEEEAAEMFSLASRLLTGAGYEHYEVSNYALPGHRSRHNQVYWAGRQYYAFGLGAASYTSGRRFSRPSKMAAYEAWVAAFVAAGSGVPAADMPPESQEDVLLDTVMLRLRTADGLDLDQLSATHGPGAAAAVRKALLRHVADGRVLCVPHSTGAVGGDGAAAAAGVTAAVAISGNGSMAGSSSSSSSSSGSGSSGGGGSALASVGSRSASCSAGSSAGGSSECAASPSSTPSWIEGPPASRSSSSTYADNDGTSGSSRHSGGNGSGAGSSSGGGGGAGSSSGSSNTGGKSARSLVALATTARRQLGGAQVVRLSDPQGFLLSNDVISDVFAELGNVRSVPGNNGR